MKGRIYMSEKELDRVGIFKRKDIQKKYLITIEVKELRTGTT